MRHGAVAAGLIAALALGIMLAAGAGKAAPAAEPLKWSDLKGAPNSLRSKSMTSGMAPQDPNAPHDGAGGAPQTPEARWMSRPAPPTAASPDLAPVKESLDGKRIRIDGYIVPLDFEKTRVKEFLLVETYGACIHVPPPPANQIIYVKAERAFEMKKSAFDLVRVTGVLKIMRTSTLAEAGYGLDADSVEPLD